ncbi:hypothetical protein CPB83DRAFT_115209 [Crepidotus variabilis]|uniref:Uncharacterized protein n=1 Tax=Crepidotus variabilis TaxID=179855 RepID=A0A9P6JIQ6_9AGAR|nr:hypothetical protein CPB83DRAFT_115209 [Crepidotus variabilis]
MACRTNTEADWSRLKQLGELKVGYMISRIRVAILAIVDNTQLTAEAKEKGLRSELQCLFYYVGFTTLMGLYLDLPYIFQEMLQGLWLDDIGFAQDQERILDFYCRLYADQDIASQLETINWADPEQKYSWWLSKADSADGRPAIEKMYPEPAILHSHFLALLELHIMYPFPSSKTFGNSFESMRGEGRAVNPDQDVQSLGSESAQGTTIEIISSDEEAEQAKSTRGKQQAKRPDNVSSINSVRGWLNSEKQTAQHETSLGLEIASQSSQKGKKAEAGSSRLRGRKRNYVESDASSSEVEIIGENIGPLADKRPCDKNQNTSAFQSQSHQYPSTQQTQAAAAEPTFFRADENSLDEGKYLDILPLIMNGLVGQGKLCGKCRKHAEQVGASNPSDFVSKTDIRQAISIVAGLLTQVEHVMDKHRRIFSASSALEQGCSDLLELLSTMGEEGFSLEVPDVRTEESDNPPTSPSAGPSSEFDSSSADEEQCDSGPNNQFSPQRETFESDDERDGTESYYSRSSRDFGTEDGLDIDGEPIIHFRTTSGVGRL